MDNLTLSLPKEESAKLLADKNCIIKSLTKGKDSDLVTFFYVRF